MDATTVISTLEELQSYTEQRAAKSPAIASRVLLRSPGLSADEASRLGRDLPGLPSTYLDCAERFALETVELGMVALRPRSLGGDGLLERLVLANGSANPVAEFLRGQDLYEVASWETDPIGVVRDDSTSGRSGQVVWVDVTSDPSFIVSPLAPDFATFMVMAGRLYQALHTGASVDEILDGSAVDARQTESWRALASMALE
ncbi:MAG: hypothetical protein ACRD0D_04045 [Acidimicrobiales bacterium]